MSDLFKIDSHKLMYHPRRVSDWMDGKNIYPIYVEIGPAGQCNCRCIFCSVDYIGYKNRSLETPMLKERLEEMGDLGVKSIMYAGEGEPFLHREMVDIIVHTKKSGLDAAITTNGILMSPTISDRIVEHTEWIKISCNAGTPETYKKIHGTKPSYFEKVINNLKEAEKIRRENGYSCTLGIQIILLPENEQDVLSLAMTARDIGLDYIVIKPYTRHSCNSHNFDIQYERFSWLAEKLNALNSGNFSAIFRVNAMQQWDRKKRGYKKCLALPFWSHIDAGGNVWGCGAHLEDTRFYYGNINTHTFYEIWEGEKRQESLSWVENSFNIEECRMNCRMDKVNQYLWDLKNPVEHVNYI